MDISEILKKRDSNQFSNQLNPDQYFIILIISSNVNDIIATELATGMYQQCIDRTNDDYTIIADTRE